MKRVASEVTFTWTTSHSHPCFIEKSGYLIHKLTAHVDPFLKNRQLHASIHVPVTLLDSLESSLLWAGKRNGSSGKPRRLASTYVSEGHQRKRLLLCKTISCLSRIHPLINKPVKQHTRNKLTNVSTHGQRVVKLGLEPMTPTLNPGPSGVYNGILWPLKILSP